VAYKPVTVIEVRVWGKRVGAVALDPKVGYYAFEYDPKFIELGIELAPLTMAVSAARQPFIFSDLPELTYHSAGG
jgi:serine/threonine-protein kinase HipA